MKTVQLFAIAVAILITAALFAVVGDAIISAPSAGASTAAHAATASSGRVSAADRTAP